MVSSILDVIPTHSSISMVATSVWGQLFCSFIYKKYSLTTGAFGPAERNIPRSFRASAALNSFYFPTLFQSFIDAMAISVARPSKSEFCNLLQFTG